MKRKGRMHLSELPIMTQISAITEKRRSRLAVHARPSKVTPADQNFREIDGALTALSISAMSALPMFSGVIGPTSL